MTKEEIEKVLKAHSAKIEPIYKKIGQVMESLHARITVLETMFFDMVKKEAKHDDQT